jgi:hypothetical protein
MGYDTEFTGHVTVTPPLNPHEIAYLRKFADTRRMDRTNGPYYVDGTGSYGQGRDADILDHNQPPAEQPGRWCGWVPTDDGMAIEWNGVEKFYGAAEWMTYLVDHFLKPDAVAQQRMASGELANPPAGFEHFAFNHVVNGTIDAQGEDPDDTWQLVVKDNEVTSTEQ